MNDREKLTTIKAEIEKRYEYWRKKEHTSHSIESEIRMSECQHLLLMVDSMQEEPVSIWHDANERPQKSGVKTAWITNEKVFYSGWYNKSAFGHEDMRDSIVKFEFDKIRKWCYLDDLLNTD